MNYLKAILSLLILPISLLSTQLMSATESEFIDNNRPLSDYIEALKIEEESIWLELQKLNISPELCVRLTKEYSEEYEDDCRRFVESLISEEPLTSAMLRVVNSVLEDFHISADTVKIVSANLDPIDCPILAAGDSYICIDEKLMNLMPESMQRFVIAHELQHSIYKDDSTRFAIEKVLDQAEFPLSHPMLKLVRFQEKRADIVAAAKSQEYAQVAVDYMQLLQRTEDRADFMVICPSAAERLDFSKEVLRRHQTR